jgi:hypothetical protein
MIDFSCDFIEKGWFRSSFNNGDSNITLDASYLNDAPLQFIVALAILCEQARNEIVCTWQSEPGEYRLLFTNQQDMITLQILQFQKNFSKSSNENAEIIFSGMDDRKKFVRRVLREFEKVKRKYTDIDYEEQWGHVYPTQEISRLRKSVKT